MALIEELDQQGNKLFKYRSILPVPFAVLGLAIYLYNIHITKSTHPLTFEIICLAVGLIGQLIRAITLGYTPKGTSGRNTHGQVAEKLNTKGMYSLMRNPLYLGNFFMWFSIILFINEHWFTILYIMCFWIYYERIIFAEENFLRNKYGKPYLKWAMETPIFIPRLRGWKQPNLSFSIKNVLKREYSGFFGLFFTFGLFDLSKNYMLNCQWNLNDFWAYSVCMTGSITIILRTLKKKTKILHVNGR